MIFDWKLIAMTAGDDDEEGSGGQFYIEIKPLFNRKIKLFFNIMWFLGDRRRWARRCLKLMNSAWNMVKFVLKMMNLCEGIEILHGKGQDILATLGGTTNRYARS